MCRSGGEFKAAGRMEGGEGGDMDSVWQRKVADVEAHQLEQLIVSVDLKGRAAAIGTKGVSTVDISVGRKVFNNLHRTLEVCMKNQILNLVTVKFTR